MFKSALFIRCFSCFVLIVTSLCIFGCDDSKRKNYDKGYEAGWEGGRTPSPWASKEEKEGYEDGLEDAWIYDIGYDDGFEERKPQYFNDALYMDAYKDGKGDKKKRW